MIRVRALHRQFGTSHAVNDLSFDVREGEVLGFLGPNGAGKTTTMRILTGSLGATSGEVTVAGHDIRTGSLDAREQLGYLPEAPPLYRSMVVRDYLDFAARLRRVPGNSRKAAVDKALDRTDLGGVAGRLIDHLSKGFRQRVGIAQALVHEPSLLILDEPTSGLDPGQTLEIRNLIAELRGDHTIVLSTHLLSEAQISCDRVLIIAGGQKVAEGTEEEVRSALGAEGTIHLTLAQPTEDCAEILAAVPGVSGVIRGDDGRFEVTTGSKDLRVAVNAAAQPFGLLESRSEGELEELYLRAVSVR
ncbi:MAG: ABC transporter ATP-binding protein [Myxococcota bacterium]|nr:ABC transporter ATP-binding protein [Myxococcota bacterium]